MLLHFRVLISSSVAAVGSSDSRINKWHLFYTDPTANIMMLLSKTSHLHVAKKIIKSDVLSQQAPDSIKRLNFHMTLIKQQDKLSAVSGTQETQIKEPADNPTVFLHSDNKL